MQNSVAAMEAFMRFRAHHWILIHLSAADHGFSFLPTLAALADGDDDRAKAPSALEAITI